MGGPGAWQLLGNNGAAQGLGIDHVVTGYCEGNIGEIFAKIAEGETPPAVIEGAAPARIPALRGATVMGNVEISRGCGLGCRFCALARAPMVHLSAEAILSDIETNLAAGIRNTSLVSEDVFRWGSKSGRADVGALLGLLAEIRRLPGLGLIQIDHANILTVTQFSDDELSEMRRLFRGESARHDYLWLNLGVETASGELLAANGGRAKMGPIEPERWGDECLEQVRRLARAGFFPLVSLVVGLPGETPRDVERTLAWVRELRRERLAIFPLLHVSLDGVRENFKAADMTRLHWRLFRECYDLNFKWIPALCWDNQRDGAGALWRRAAQQCLGRFQTVWWKSVFALRSTWGPS
jgi:radical SAM superfamily enzyme YgiQ (UPF0313 family)